MQNGGTGMQRRGRLLQLELTAQAAGENAEKGTDIKTWDTGQFLTSDTVI